MSLRHGTAHDVLACWFGVDRSTITRDWRGPAAAGATRVHRRPGYPADSIEGLIRLNHESW
ncbi:hypothetical protein [Streptomyces sp. YIM B13518]|uniref:hypothetical protein n=1 Tax=Streptomyces sp. YIM B13518 TaxID=3366316 RepID=UPI00367DB64C